jgi:hypothetical protein
MIRRVVLCAAAVSALATPARAQSAKRQVVSINPLGIPAGFYSGEYELAVSRNVSGALGASYFALGSDFDEVSYLSGDVKLRYYPQRALEGFSVGVSAGVIRLGAENSFDDGSGEIVDDSESGMTIGTSFDYSWLLGERKGFAVGLGAGFKRVVLFGGEVPDVTTFYPTLRLSVGAAF